MKIDEYNHQWKYLINVCKLNIVLYAQIHSYAWHIQKGKFFVKKETFVSRVMIKVVLSKYTSSRNNEIKRKTHTLCLLFIYSIVNWNLNQKVSNTKHNVLSMFLKINVNCTHSYWKRWKRQSRRSLSVCHQQMCVQMAWLRWMSGISTHTFRFFRLETIDTS